MIPRFDIRGEIGHDAKASDLEAFLLANSGPVLVGINSPGGVATDGAAMMAYLQRHGDVTAQVVGVAASAASLAMLGARKIVVHQAALIMIHEPALFSYGTAAQLREDAATLEKMASTYAQAYARATGHPVERIAAWMAEETWMTAQEAVNLNFCDEIEGAGGEAVARFDYRRFRNAPPQLAAMVIANGWASAPDDQKGS